MSAPIPASELDRYIADYAAELVERGLMQWGAICKAIADVTDDKDQQETLRARLMALLPGNLYHATPSVLRSLS